jgi:hypothetical protein
MRNACEFREQFGEDGRRTVRQWAIGPIVPLCILGIFVLLVCALTGKAITIPAPIWQFISKLM